MMASLSGIISELNSTGAPLSALFLSFLVFSFIGWLYESTICALANYGHFANSGFLLGPCCPIYGVGSLACWFLLRDIPSVVVQFAAAALVCSAIEYGVGAALERITGARFWDYSKFPFNINGRVCLYGAALFGAGAVLICRIAEPALLNALELMPPTILAAAAFACAALLVIDTVFTLVSWRQLSQKLELLRISTGAPLSALFLSFIVFSFIGWLYESTICALANYGHFANSGFVFSFIGWLYESTICALANYGHFANSGFLLGPCCPIYGVGSLACWFLLRDIPSVAVQFAAAALVCSAIEYGVGTVWDHSHAGFCCETFRASPFSLRPPRSYAARSNTA